VSTSGSTRYLVIISANISPNTTGNVGWVSYAVSGAVTQAASDLTAVSFGNTAAQSSQGSFEGVVTAPTTASVTFTMQQKPTANNKVDFANRTITVVPLN
jgi:hypothetical protein